MRIVHIGIAVSDLDRAMTFYQNIFWQCSIIGPFEDPIQKVKVCFLEEKGHDGPQIELIAPLTDDSPITGYLSRNMGAYHICCKVKDINSSLADLRSKGCVIISLPVPAVAYEGRKIAWCFTPTNHLIELVEAA
jgi:methylmalonyl-CoA/ethylmalonyl-CoA epimerase